MAVPLLAVIALLLFILVLATELGRALVGMTIMVALWILAVAGLFGAAVYLQGH